MITEKRRKEETRWANEKRRREGLHNKTQYELVDIICYQGERLDFYQKILKSILNKTTKALK